MRWLAGAAVASALAAVLTAVIVLEGRAADGLSRPYVWPDLAAVFFLAAVPFASIAAGGLMRLLDRPGVTLAAAAIATILLLTQFDGDAQWLEARSAAWPGEGMLHRAAPVLVLTTAAFVMVASLAALWSGGRQPFSLPRRTAWLLPALIASVAVPAAYTDARCAYHEQKLSEYLSQGRLAQPRNLARELVALAPGTRVSGRPLGLDRQVSIRKVSRELQRRIRNVETRVAQPLAGDVPAAARLERARLLAQLARFREAEEVLRPLVEHTPPHVAACNLLGTIYEQQENWRTSREWYRRGRRAWRESPPSDRNPVERVTAIKGIAYTERKLGRYREAEAAYQEALALAPTAETHFLLARFYEDTQQATKAHRHAREAMRRAPRRYRAAAEELIDGLVTRHFGCLPVFRRETGAGR